MIDKINIATSSEIIYSIAEAAKANNFKRYDYFEYLLTEVSKYTDNKSNDFLRDFRICSEILSEHIRKRYNSMEVRAAKSA